MLKLVVRAQTNSFAGGAYQRTTLWSCKEAIMNQLNFIYLIFCSKPIKRRQAHSH